MSEQDTDHERIYLQHCDDGGVGGADEGRSFCVDRVDVNGVPDTAYVRADLYDTLTAENERLQTDVQELATVREQVRAALRGEPIVGYDEAEQVVRLQAIVDKLPKTADGVPVVPGMNVFVLRDDGVIQCHRVFTVQFNGCHSTNGEGIGLPENCYSTYAAAEQARKDEI